MSPFAHGNTRITCIARYSCSDTRNACQHDLLMESIHYRIKRLRAAKNMTLEELAARVGVSYQTVQQWEREDGTAPKRARQEAVADALGVSVAYLVTGVDTTEVGRHDTKKPYLVGREVENAAEIQELIAAYESAPGEVKQTIQMILRAASSDPEKLHVVEPACGGAMIPVNTHAGRKLIA